MLQHHTLIPSKHSSRFASQLSKNLADSRLNTSATDNAESTRKPSLILSRLSERTRSRIHHGLDIAKKSTDVHVEIAAAAHKTPRSRATSFVSAQSAQKRDRAAEKWFKDIRELDIFSVDRQDGLKSLPRIKPKSEFPKQHEMRPRTDLIALFAPSISCSATSLRMQAKRELGGDYTSYLPDRCADPYQLPIAYARLLLGRNKHIPLNAQTGALSIIEEAIQGKTTRQVA